MILNDNILDRLSDKIGQDVRTPEGATILTLDLQNEYKEKAPSVNTVKRMVGLSSSFLLTFMSQLFSD